MKHTQIGGLVSALSGNSLGMGKQHTEKHGNKGLEIRYFGKIRALQKSLTEVLENKITVTIAKTVCLLRKSLKWYSELTSAGLETPCKQKGRIYEKNN